MTEKEEGMVQAFKAMFVGLIFVGFLFLWSWVFAVCWNFSVTHAFGAPSISFWHSFGMIVMVRVTLLKVVLRPRKEEEM